MTTSRVHAAIQEMAAALHRLGQSSSAERVFELIGSSSDLEASLSSVMVPWHDLDDAHLFLGPLCDANGIVAGCLVRIDAGHAQDKDSVFRQANFDSTQNAFVCPSSGSALANVNGWALGSAPEL